MDKLGGLLKDGAESPLGGLLSLLALLGVGWGMVQGLVRTQDAVASVPALRSEFQAHLRSENEQYQRLLKEVQGVRSDQRVTGRDLAWIKETLRRRP